MPSAPSPTGPRRRRDTDYELPEGDCVVAAGEVYGYIPIRFFRRASLDGKELTLTLELLPNEQFDLPLSAWLPVNGTETVGTDVLRHTVTVSDKYVRLDGWSDALYGPYSDKKIKLMCSVFDLTLADYPAGRPVVRRTQGAGTEFPPLPRRGGARRADRL